MRREGGAVERLSESVCIPLAQEGESDVVLATACQAKGLEWDRVKVNDACSSNTVAQKGWRASEAKMALTSPADMSVPCLYESATRAPASTGANGRWHS